MPDESVGLRGASDRIREAAKWFAVSVAALGAVMAAGSQLTGIGRLAINSGRLWLAVVGAIVAVCGALVILWAVVETMTGRAVSLHSIATVTPRGAEGAVADPTLLGGYPTVHDIETEYLDAVKQRRAAYEDARAQPEAAEKVTAAGLADNRFVAIDQVVSQLLDVVSYQHLTDQWRSTRLRVVIGAAVAAVGLGSFAWAANPPPDATASMAAANVLARPKAGQVRLTPTGISALEEAVGKGCWGAAPTATGPVGQPSSTSSATNVTLRVLVLGQTAAGPDVLVDQTGCNHVRVLLGSEWGTLSE